MYGYCGRVLRIDLTAERITIEPLPREWARNYLGGRGLNIKRLYTEVPREADPLGPENKLIIGVGPLNGTFFPGAARVNFTARSPQTGILGDSNAGGFFGPELKYAGFDQVILEGQAGRPVYIFIHDGLAEIKSAGHLRGLDVWQTQAAIRQELGDSRVQVAAIGPAAENGVRFAGIFCNLVRAAARTGMGTVLASKGVKAIAVRGRQPLALADPRGFADLVQAIDREIYDHWEYQTRVLLGTTKLVHALNEAGCLATRHFTTGRFEAAEDVSGERLAETVKLKSKACFACTIPCSRFFRIKEGPYRGLASEGPEFEGLAGFSSRVGNPDLDFALQAVDCCNRLGMDVITTSEVISFVMELYARGMLTSSEADGLDLTWGNKETILSLINKIARREGFGDILADGVRAAARRLGKGEDLAMHIKGLEVFQADPRGLKGYALGLAVASRGGDHLRSEPSFEFYEDPEAGRRRFGAPEAAFRLEYKGKGRVVKYYEERCALADSLNACKNTLVNMEILPYEQAAALLRAAVGWDYTPEELRQIGERIVNLERAYIVSLGIRRADDTLPRRFLEEPLPEGSGPSTGQVVELEPMLDEYYTARGWNRDTGIPEPEKLAALGLQEALADLRSRGILP
ncbi:aldehyde:ferredoxin oxidoreductase [Moorella thermoacetica Y72]|uniref:Aldehyde:ferredoxin oxidoreductase n=1 Tax=Moorella thermoacetica Y72 TaxID=1325331 RepID=A0A0S6UDA7_NEOTH|nr:aldehyde ferredoxin oxidoreductase family protein [Moorella thermoacetica]GAF25928.1 aldehyde:ferredoxin oxidoreductase [Moorella thermoacetica Y72]